jgi:predicted nucleic-acid-binding Zn-ribbon protein
MSASMTCPKCGAHHPAGTHVCGCGHRHPETAPIGRPFDVGKPLGTAYPVSPACPKCGAGDYESVKPEAMVAFVSDRVCRACSTRYTPPTPAWARLVFGAIGLASCSTASSPPAGGNRR